METSTAVAIFIYVLAVGFLLVFGVVVFKMMKGVIKLDHLLSEPSNVPNPKASLSRFQLFVFTFVVAGLFLVLSIENGQIIEIPQSVLGLLGISGGSYLVSKGIK